MSWYVISTPRHQERLVKQMLDSYALPTDALVAAGYKQDNGGGNLLPFKTFLPLRKEKVNDLATGQPKAVTVPVIAGLIFVQTTKSLLDFWLGQTATGSQLYVDNTNAPIVVPDYQIRLFKDYLSFVASDVMVLRKPYSYFLGKKKIRILSGKFAGLEGRLFQIKGNYKLVYGLGNTALALSDIAKNPYVEITDEDPAKISYSFYYHKMKEEIGALLEEGVEPVELLRCLNRWRQEASILTQDSPVSSTYVSLSLQQTFSDLYAKHRNLFEEKHFFRKIKSIYQDTEDYLSITSTQIEDAAIQRQIQQRREKIQSRTLYATDPLGLKQEAGPSTTYGFLREQEASFVEILALLDSEQDLPAIGMDVLLKNRRQAFRKLFLLFKTIASKLEQRNLRESLDSTANYRLRKLLTQAAHQYRRCKTGQDESFVKKTQLALKEELLAHDLYQPQGYFDLLGTIRRSPKVE